MSLNQRECIYIQANGSAGAAAAIQVVGGGQQAKAITAVLARTGAGVFTLTFGSAIKVAEYMVDAWVLGGAANANANFSVNAAGTVWTVSTSVGAVATDEDFVFYAEPIAL